MSMTITQAADYVQAVVEGHELDLRPLGEPIYWPQMVDDYVGTKLHAICMTPAQLLAYRQFLDDPRANHFLGAKIRTSER